METMAPTRPAVQPARCIPLSVGPSAVAEARTQVRSAICAWNLAADASTAALLTSELVTNALQHEPTGTVMLVLSCSYGQLRVDVHDTGHSMPVPVNAPADAETGRGLMLVAGLSTDWGFYRTPGGKAVYFTLGFQADHDRATKDRAPQDPGNRRRLPSSPGTAR